VAAVVTFLDSHQVHREKVCRFDEQKGRRAQSGIDQPAAALEPVMMRVYQHGRSSTECEPAGNHQLIVNLTGDTDDEIRAQRRARL
jgi:hypothetical protein